MGLTAQEAEEYRQSILQRQKDARKERVEWILSRALPIEEVEKRFKMYIERRPEDTFISVYVLDIVTNDWDDPNRKKVLADVKEELIKKYEEEFPDADLEEAPSGSGNQGMAFKLTMRLS